MFRSHVVVMAITTTFQCKGFQRRSSV